MAKLKALIIGGEDRNITDEVRAILDYVQIEQRKHKFPATTAPEAEVVIVIARWVAREASDLGKRLARQRGIPFVQCQTGNYIISELERRKEFASFIRSLRATIAAEEKQTEAANQAPVPETAIPEAALVANKPEETATVLAVPQVEQPEHSGLSYDELWSQYGAKMIELVRTVLSPGEKVQVDSLMDLIKSELGLPKGDAMQLLTEGLGVSGIMRNTVGSTWMLVDPDADYEEDKEPASEPKLKKLGKAPKAEQPKSVRDHGIKLCEIISGLPEGPYETRRDVYHTACRCPEFKTKSGEEVKPSYGDLIMVKAERLGVIEKLEDGRWKVNRDPRISIVLVDDKPSKLVEKKLRPDEKKKLTLEERFQREMEKLDADERRQKQLAEPPKPGPKTITLADGVRRSFDGVIPVFGPWTSPMRKFKKLLPDLYWDESACRTISRQLKSRNHDEYLKFKGEFDDAEWDALAWQTLRFLPLDVIAPLIADEKLVSSRADMTLTCKDCLDKFVFSVQDQEFYSKQFGEVTPPARCLKCRKNSRKEARI